MTEGEEVLQGGSRLDRWRRQTGLVAGPVLGICLYWLLPSSVLSHEARSLAGILAFTVVYWVCEPIPLSATALISPLLCVICGVAEAKKVFAPFSSSIIFLFIGTFILAEAAAKHGLDQRFALRVLCCPGVARSPTTMLLAIGGVAAFISMWTSNAATTALITPVVLGLIRANRPFADPRVASSLLLMVAFAATAGGLATPVGTPPNLISLGFMQELLHERPSFVEWMKIGVPLTVVLIVALVVILRPRGVGRFENHGAMANGFRAQADAMGRMSAGERNVVIAFVAALICWLYPGLAEAIGDENAPGLKWFSTHLPDDLIGLGAGLLLFVLPTNAHRWEFTVSWRDAAKIDWGTILLFGGGMALGSLIFSTGLAKTTSDLLLTNLGTPGLWTLVGGGILMSILLSEFTSNTAAANVMVPLMIGLALASKLDAVTVALATALACSFGCMLPVSTAPNAIVYGTGRVPLRRMVVAGIMFDAVGGVAIWVWMRLAG